MTRYFWKCVIKTEMLYCLSRMTQRTSVPDYFLQNKNLVSYFSLSQLLLDEDQASHLNTTNGAAVKKTDYQGTSKCLTFLKHPFCKLISNRSHFVDKSKDFLYILTAPAWLWISPSIMLMNILWIFLGTSFPVMSRKSVLTVVHLLFMFAVFCWFVKLCFYDFGRKSRDSRHKQLIPKVKLI